MTQIDPEIVDDFLSAEGSLAQRVYKALLQGILNLKIAPGMLLHKDQLCALFGVSRAPVVEAITRLSFDGLVQVVPQSGSYVSYLSLAEIRESAFMREALELAATAEVARNCTQVQLSQIRRNLRLQEILHEDGDAVGFYEADEEFHDLIMSATGFARLSATVRTVSLKLKRARVLILPSPGRMDTTLDEHREIFMALEQRDPRLARAAMHAHLERLLPRIEELQSIHPQFFGPSPQISEAVS